MMIRAGKVARLGEMRNAYRVLVQNPKGKRQLGRIRGRWESNNKTEHREIGLSGVDWIHLA
jgi:hypothetical protein